MTSFSISLPYSPYRVECADPLTNARRPLPHVVVSLAKNSQLRTGNRHQAIVREAKRQMKEDVGWEMKLASWPEMRAPFVLDALVLTRTGAAKDDDGAWTALYPARDAMAAALGINDSEIVTGVVTFQKCRADETEKTVLTLKGS